MYKQTVTSKASTACGGLSRAVLIGHELHDLLRIYLSQGRAVVKNQELVISNVG